MGILLDILLVLLLHGMVFGLLCITAMLYDFSMVTDSLGTMLLTIFSVIFNLIIYGVILFSLTPMIMNAHVLIDIVIGFISIAIACGMFAGVLTISDEVGHFKTVSITAIKNKISKNYNKEQGETILRLIYALKNSRHIELDGLTVNVSNDISGSWSYDRRNRKERVIKSVTAFVNNLIKYADNKNYTQIVESILLEKENAHLLAFVLNIFEDKEKVRFIFSSDGFRQLEMLGDDLEKLNAQVNDEVVKIKKVTDETYINKMNTEIDSLRKNRFDKVEDMKKD